MFLETADRIGARLCRDAIWYGGRCNWLGEYDGSCVALGPTLYKGSNGIALFLKRLFEATGEPIYKKTAEGALARVANVERLGLYDGIAGIAFSGTSRQACASLVERKPDASRHDIISGSAGIIPVLLSLSLVDLAIAHGQSLIDHATRTDAGWSWTGNLTGFAHGAAGIGWALAELFHVTRDEQFRRAAIEAFRYEHSVYRPDEENWPDFRKEPVNCSVQWCHGAPGIGFSRLRAAEIFDDETCREEARAAIRTTTQSLANVSEGNFCLCHGHAGNADLLLYAGEPHAAVARRVGEEGIRFYESERMPWPCDSPDLMLGLAGIGYFYLRLHDPVKVPSILLIIP